MSIHELVQLRDRYDNGEINGQETMNLLREIKLDMMNPKFVKVLDAFINDILGSPDEINQESFDSDVVSYLGDEDGD
jgi:hypothetical protein